jgi:hypothetical protein
MQLNLAGADRFSAGVNGTDAPRVVPRVCRTGLSLTAAAQP